MIESELANKIDLKLWKKIQDNISSVMNATICTIDEFGQEILVSSEHPYYCKLVKSKKRGNDLCRNSRRRQIEKLKESDDNIIFYKCHCGLINIMVPIMIGNKQYGALMCSSLRREQDNVNSASVSSLIGVGNDELDDALKEISFKLQEDIKAYGSVLYILSKTLPELAYEKATTDKKISELTVLHKITQMVNSTLDLEQVFKSIMTFMLQSVKAKTVSILIFDGNKRYSLSDPSENMMKVEGIVGYEASQSKSVVRVPDIMRDYRFNGVTLDFSSIYSIPLKQQDNVIGTINIIGDYLTLKDPELEFLSIVSTQAAMAITNAKQFAHVKESAITDKLTGLYNRRHFMDILKNEVERSKRFKKPTSVALLDVDFFKQYNDAQGHQKGDKLLSELSNILAQNVRAIDTVGRYGGEEFIIVFPETKPHESQLVAERVRKAIEEYYFDAEEKQPNGRVTISLGLVTCMNGSLTQEELIKHADSNLYKAKRAGKNKVVASVFLDKSLNPVEVI